MTATTRAWAGLASGCPSTSSRPRRAPRCSSTASRPPRRWARRSLLRSTSSCNARRATSTTRRRRRSPPWTAAPWSAARGASAARRSSPRPCAPPSSRPARCLAPRPSRTLTRWAARCRMSFPGAACSSCASAATGRRRSRPWPAIAGRRPTAGRVTPSSPSPRGRYAWCASPRRTCRRPAPEAGGAGARLATARRRWTPRSGSSRTAPPRPTACPRSPSASPSRSGEPASTSKSPSDGCASRAVGARSRARRAMTIRAALRRSSACAPPS
mmetsp:Transcript_17349/g.58169  ORF Transcript_17349/g.58169 Transcript_17349/m.58169 type:complete len:271 (+) Transcript_17349:139-951(+)